MGHSGMHEKIVEIPTADGRMETFITHPEQGGPFAPVVVYMDVWGLREELYDIARKVAVSSYLISTIARAASATNGATSRGR